MELFGYKVEKQLGSATIERGSTSFVAPDLNDGSTVINGGGVNAFTTNFDVSLVSRDFTKSRGRTCYR